MSIQVEASPIVHSKVVTKFGKFNVPQGSSVFFDLKMLRFVGQQGLPWGKYPHPKNINVYDPARVYEVAYTVVDEKGNPTSSYSTLIKPSGFEINKPFEGSVTTQLATNAGVYAFEALNKFYTDTIHCNNFISHCAPSKLNALVSEAYRFQSNVDFKVDEWIAELSKKTIVCLMISGKDFYKLPKFPKLAELYWAAFAVEIETDHKSATDAKLMKDCYDNMVSLTTSSFAPPGVPFRTFGSGRSDTYSTRKREPNRYQPYYQQQQSFPPPPQLRRQQAYSAV